MQRSTARQSVNDATPAARSAVAYDTVDAAAFEATWAPVAHHVADRQAAAREVRRVLKRGAPVLIRSGFAGRDAGLSAGRNRPDPVATALTLTGSSARKQMPPTRSRGGRHLLQGFARIDVDQWLLLRVTHRRHAWTSRFQLQPEVEPQPSQT